MKQNKTKTKTKTIQTVVDAAILGSHNFIRSPAVSTQYSKEEFTAQSQALGKVLQQLKILNEQGAQVQSLIRYLEAIQKITIVNLFSAQKDLHKIYTMNSSGNGYTNNHKTGYVFTKGDKVKLQELYTSSCNGIKKDDEVSRLLDNQDFYTALVKCPTTRLGVGSTMAAASIGGAVGGAVGLLVGIYGAIIRSDVLSLEQLSNIFTPPVIAICVSLVLVGAVIGAAMAARANAQDKQLLESAVSILSADPRESVVRGKLVSI